MATGTIRSRVEFIMDLGKALHQQGTPAYRFEEAMKSVSRSLGLEGEFFSVPTSIQAQLTAGEQEYHRLLRVEPGATHLEKLCALDELGDAVVSGALTPAEGSKRISRILGARDRYAPWLSVLCQGISSAAISVFFRAGFWDVAVAFVLGLGVGLIGAGARRFQGVERLREALAAFAATLVASLAALALPKVSVPVVVLAGLISQFPGLTLTIAMSELATDNLVSGTARLMQAVATLLKLVFGAALGARAAELLGARPWIVASSPAPAHWIPLAVISASLTAVVLFRARPRDTGWVVLAGALAYVSAALGQQWLGPRIGAFAGGWALGAAANLFARIMSRPATLMVLPGLLILVPGSLGYRSLSSLFDHDVITGMDTAFTVVVVAASIVAGLLFGNVMVSPRRSL